MKRILIIEDEAKIQEILTEFLQEYGYAVDNASDGVAGIAKFSEEKYDLILLDIMMPKIDGLAVLELIREKSDIPIILITAMETEAYQIKGFDLRADDYITKPFSMNLVIRRIEAVLRRTQTDEVLEKEQGMITHGSVKLDKESCVIKRSDESIPCTYKEYELIKLLLENKNKVFTRDDILNQIWGYDFFGNDKIVNNHIMRIRKKLGENFIVTVRGVGYKIGKED